MSWSGRRWNAATATSRDFPMRLRTALWVYLALYVALTRSIPARAGRAGRRALSRLHGRPLGHGLLPPAHRHAVDEWLPLHAPGRREPGPDQRQLPGAAPEGPAPGARVRGRVGRSGAGLARAARAGRRRASRSRRCSCTSGSSPGCRPFPDRASSGRRASRRPRAAARGPRRARRVIAIVIDGCRADRLARRARRSSTACAPRAPSTAR